MRIPKLFVLVLLVGLLFRCHAFFNTQIVNPDGVLYINQAKALYYGEWEKLPSCGLTYIANYPFFIAAAYPVFKDWILSARMVSICFGFLTLIPLYALLRRFFDSPTSSFVTLVYALIPIFIGFGTDVVRDPVYWFFLVSGLFLFIYSMQKSFQQGWLLLCGFSFLLATWARVEGFLFILISILYLVMTEKRGSIKKILFFLAPLVVSVCLIAVIGDLKGGLHLDELHRGPEILGKFDAPLQKYRELRQTFTQMISQTRDESLSMFLSRTRNSIWLIALGTLVNYSLEAFFYPFLPFFILGFKGIRGMIREDRRLLYFLLLVISGYALLYLHLFQTWFMDYRFLAIVIFPCAVFAGFGVQTCVRYIAYKTHWKEGAVFITLAVLLTLFVLPKNLISRDPDKVVFRDIGRLIAARKDVYSPVGVSASVFTHRWISYYANESYPGALCLAPTVETSWEMYPVTSLDDWMGHWRKAGIKYVLWVEKRWPAPIGLQQIDSIPCFKKLGSWDHPDTGLMVLFELN